MAGWLGFRFKGFSERPTGPALEIDYLDESIDRRGRFGKSTEIFLDDRMPCVVGVILGFFLKLFAQEVPGKGFTRNFG